MTFRGIVWTKKHKIRIPYRSERGLETYYVPDFLIEDDRGRFLVEVKGWKSSEVRVKAFVAIDFCKQRGMGYLLLLGKDREVCLDLSYWRDDECKVL